jgi:hypothetical protein
MYTRRPRGRSRIVVAVVSVPPIHRIAMAALATRMKRGVNTRIASGIGIGMKMCVDGDGIRRADVLENDKCQIR